MKLSKSQAGKLGAVKTQQIFAEKKRNLIEQYNKNPIICKHCGNPHSFEKIKNKFCSINCATTYNNLKTHWRDVRGLRKQNISCFNCGENFKEKHQKKFCSGKCQQEFQSKEYITNWKSGLINGCNNGVTKGLSKFIKKYIFEKFNNTCSCCGQSGVWNNKPLKLQIEHIDGNSENNTENNLTLLCPNCHTQTPTFGAKNKGNGRYWRRVRYSEGKSS